MPRREKQEKTTSTESCPHHRSTPVLILSVACLSFLNKRKEDIEALRITQMIHQLTQTLLNIKFIKH